MTSPEGAAKGTRYVALAEIARPHGVQGELRLKVYNTDSDLLLHRPAMRLRFADGTERDVKLERARASNSALLVKIAGVASRDAAEELRGALVLVPRDEFPPLEDGEFYACDIEGAEASLATGEVIGKVRGIQSYPTCTVLVIERGEGAPAMEVPLVDSHVASVDIEQHRVVLVTVDGL